MIRASRPARPAISRRHFLALTGGVVLAGCAGASGTSDEGRTPSPSSTTTASTVPRSVPTTVTTVEIDADAVPDGRVLVLVELAGGNDAVNTLIPLAGPSAAIYRSLRPALAIDEGSLIPYVADWGLHPSLAPLTGLSDRLATVSGIGFADPNRSHFVSFDRWWRADRLDESTGWLGRWLDTLGADIRSPLAATAVGRGSPVLRAESASSTAVAGSFAFADLFRDDALSGFAGSGREDDPVLAAAQRAWQATSAAVTEFEPIASALVEESYDDEAIAATSGFQQGLSLAAELVTGDVGARVVVVSVGGFDTHSRQLETHAALLADLAAGVTGFWSRIDQAGIADRVLMMTQSEFGRRVAQNGSDGSDHGAAGVSFVLGGRVDPGLRGVLDLADLHDGDVRPVHDPRELFTVALDWLGGDVERVLGARYDGLDLLV